MSQRLLLLAALASLAPALAGAQTATERLQTAKAFLLDRQYAEARQMLQSVRGSGRSAEAQQALYWTARCSEGLGESERALGEYGDYLASRPTDRSLAEEARTSRVALAVKLVKAGQPQHLEIARDALDDSSRTVRFFAALQLGSLGPGQGQPAVPVLKEILAKERDEDLVERAKLYLLRLDPKALAAPHPAQGARRDGGWIRLRVYEKDQARPQVSINLPVTLADLVLKSLPSETRRELRRKGIDTDNIWDRLKETGPTDILKIEGDEGERIELWIE